MKTSSKICIIATMVLLSGCRYQIVNHNDIALATAWCKDKGGIDYIVEYSFGTTKFKCISDGVSAASTHEEDAAKKLFLKVDKL